TVATACPFCMTMLKDGLSDAQSESAAAGNGVVSARDIAEILADVVIAEPAGPPVERRTSGAASRSSCSRTRTISDEIGVVEGSEGGLGPFRDGLMRPEAGHLGEPRVNRAL